ncbi:MAG: hypothetical protein FJW36_05620 [Acidobacteria bacterium]|nr:hypothetical protein [Acidobacteriota bacterium]
MLLVVAASSQDADVVLRSTMRLVTVDVVVRNKDRKPVGDLSPADFVVLDNGKRQKVRIFKRPSELGVREDGRAIVARMHLAEDLPAGIATNFSREAAAPAPVVTVILFDALNTPIDDQRVACK